MSRRISVRFATVADEPCILAFLREHWVHDHIFVTNPELMRWQHRPLDRDNRQLNFVLATEESGGDNCAIIALLGFIPFKRFDPDADSTEVALAIWKVKDGSGVPGLGLQLLKFLERELVPSFICAIGISQIVKPIYRALGYEVGVMRHSALFPEGTGPGGKIAQGIPGAARVRLPNRSDVRLRSIDRVDNPIVTRMNEVDRLGQMGVPHKSWSYLVNRYMQHPWYRYELRAVEMASETKAILVWRVVSARDATILRIVDIIGDSGALAVCGGALRHEIELAGAEYIDLVDLGIAEEVLTSAGFVSTSEYDDLVLPNYFSPFEKRNVQIGFAFKRSTGTPGGPVRLFRADSDQDRPNSPSELIFGGSRQE